MDSTAKHVTEEARTLVRLESVSVQVRDKVRQARRILTDISLQIKEGELVGIAGGSGAGKTTLLRLLLGRIPLNATVTGRIHVIDNESLKNVSLSSKKQNPVSQSVAYVPQNTGSTLNPVFRIEDQLLETACLDRHIDRSSRTKTLDEIAAKYQLDRGILSRYPHEASGGQIQRVMIAMAMLRRPKLLLVDEITSGLDLKLATEIIQYILDHRDNASIVWISHDLMHLTHVTNRIIIMNSGYIIEQVEKQHRGVWELRESYSKQLFGYCLPKTQPEAQSSVHLTKKAQPSRPILVADAISAAYDEPTPVLKELRLTVDRGTITGVMGRSGSGKSTLLKALTGSLFVQTGTIRYYFDGAAAALAPNKPIDLKTIRQNIGMILQNPHASFDPKRTIRQAISDIQRRSLKQIIKGSSIESDSYALELLRQVTLEPKDVLDKYPFQLSGGECQRVALVRALLNQPQILICDEPVSALDFEAKYKVIDIILKLKKQYNLTVLFVSHDVDVLRQICDKVAVIEGGIVTEMVETAKLNELRSDIIQTYVYLSQHALTSWSLNPSPAEV